MANLGQNELQFLQRMAENPEVGSVSHLLRAIASGVELTSDDILSIEDYLMDRTAELDNEGLEVPAFFDGIRSIIAKVMSTAPAKPQSNGPVLPGFEPAGQIPQQFQAKAPQKQRKPRVPKPESDEPKITKKEKYKDCDLTAENIPQYLVDIHNIVNLVVEARCAEEIERRIAAEKKLEKLQSVLKGL